MNVEALDHVNIITDRLDATAEFYGKLLGLSAKEIASLREQGII